jgi:CRISPR-associated protein Cas2
MSARLAYLVCYDICEPGRLRLVYRTMRGYGQHLQYSVFRCELTESEKVQMIGDLQAILNHDEDKVLIVHLGPPNGHHASQMETLGLPLPSLERYAVVV